MGINEGPSLLHWNYFIAIDQDLETVSRYIEFTEDNFDVYSIELVRLLLASSSEVDVVLQGICKILAPGNPVQSINGYRKVICERLQPLIYEYVLVPRYNLTLKPWSNWESEENKNPLWWRSYNNVKHHRHEYYRDANLKNVLNSVSGLYISVLYYYKLKFESERKTPQKIQDVHESLKPAADFLKLRDEYYYGHLILE